MRVTLVVDVKNIPPPYASKAKGAATNFHARILISILVLVLASGAGFLSAKAAAHSQDDHSAKATEAASQSAKAAKVFDEIMQTPDKSIPRDLLSRAKAIAVFPQVIKASFVVGGEGGRGVVIRRVGTGWSDPVFFRAGGGSFGWQIGATATDFVLLFMNDDAVGGLMKDKFELGAEAGVAGGPVGREAGAGTDALMQAEVVSYSRSRGLFAGVSLKGVVVRPEDDLNEAVYNQRARDLLADDKKVAGSEGGLPAFPKTVAKYTDAKSAHP